MLQKLAGTKTSKHAARNHLAKIRPSQISCFMNGSGHGSLALPGPDGQTTLGTHNMWILVIVESCNKQRDEDEKRNQCYSTAMSLLSHYLVIVVLQLSIICYSSRQEQ